MTVPPFDTSRITGAREYGYGRATAQLGRCGDFANWRRRAVALTATVWPTSLQLGPTGGSSPSPAAIRIGLSRTPFTDELPLSIKNSPFHQMNHRCPHSGSLAMLHTAEICCLNSGYVVPGRTEPATAPGRHRGHSVRSGDCSWCGRKGRRSTVSCSSGLTKLFSSASTRRRMLIPRLR